MSKKKLRVCLCSQCKAFTHLDSNGNSQQGSLIELRAWKQHQANDELKADEEDHLLYTALVVSVAHERGEVALPSRPRDLMGSDEGSQSPGGDGYDQPREVRLNCMV